MCKRSSSWQTPGRLKEESQGTVCRNPSSHQRLRERPKHSGLWCTVSVKSATASSRSCGACTGGKSGLAPASCLHLQPLHSSPFIAADPLADRVGAPGLEQPMQSHLKHREPARHFQDGCSPLTHVGFLVVVTHPLSFFRLCCCQVNAAGLCHDRSLLREVGFLLEYHDRINLFMFIIGLGLIHAFPECTTKSLSENRVLTWC